jgi:predicted MFS family arabinose efflux permease
LTFSGRINVWWIAVLAIFQGLVDAFDRPARQTLLVQLADKESLLSAISLNSVMFNLSRIAGPSLGGLVVAAFGEGVCFMVNAISFLAVIGGLSMMRLEREPRAAADSHPWRELAEGFAYVGRTRRLWPLLAMSTAVQFAIAPMFTLAPVFADGVFHRGSAGAGFLMGALGVGAVIGTVGLAARRTTGGLWLVSAQSTLLLALALAALAAAPSYGFALACMPVAGCGLMRQNASTNTQVQAMLDEAFRGRVMGIYAAAVIGMFPLGSLAGGALAAAFGVRTAFALCAALLAAAAAAFWRVVSALHAQGLWERSGSGVPA